MKQFILYLVVAPLLIMGTVLYFWFAKDKRPAHYWWNSDRETYVMFSTVQQHHRGSIEVRSKGKDFFKPGVPFKGQWLIWNNSFFEKKFRVHLWIYNKKFQRWTKYTLKDQEHIITLAPMEDILISTIGYIDPDVMAFERWTYEQSAKQNNVGFKHLPNSRSVTINIVISDPEKPAPTFSKKKIVKKNATNAWMGDPLVDPGLRVGELPEDDDDYPITTDEPAYQSRPPEPQHYPNAVDNQ